MRTVCVWCPDWPVVALCRADRAPSEGPVVVVERGRVRAASASARAAGVRRGMRRRDAEARCPEVALLDADPVVEARGFEPVAQALDDVTPRIALERPGLLTFPARGPARYFGSDEQVARRVMEVVTSQGGVEVRVGIAGSRFAAHLAARRADPVLILGDEETPSFLARHPVRVLADEGPEAAELSGLLVRLGIRTLGDLAALPEASVAARFEVLGVEAHRLARGLDASPARLADPPPDLAEATEFDPPAQRVDTAAFAAKGLADRFVDALAARGLACSRVVVEAETEHGERLVRLWRHQGALTAAALAQRVRWQLEAWLTGRIDAPEGDSDPAPGSTTGGLTLLRLVPDQVFPARGHQLGFWGGDQRAADQASRVLARLQGMFGRDAVLSPLERGGRTPAEQMAWIPWGEPRDPAGTEAPWPGSVPAPAPARVHVPPLASRLLDANETPVRVSGRGEISAAPAWFECDAVGVRGPVETWAGPWVHDVHWWDPARRRRRAIFQVVARGVACLVVVERGQAAVEGVYD